MLHAHSQFCVSGDNTLPATEDAIRATAAAAADERFVVVLSDANFDRYGISPRRFSALLTSDPTVNAYAVFIGSLGDQATRWVKGSAALGVGGGGGGWGLGEAGVEGREG